MIILSAEQMQRFDRITIEEIGVPGIVLMENAGIGCVNIILNEFIQEIKKGILIIAGPGNNGGDGFVIARHLFLKNYDVKVVILSKKEKFKGDALLNLRAILGLGLDVTEITSENELQRITDLFNWPGLIVDSIFGTGLKRELTGHFRGVVEQINSADAKVFSVDIPSGLSSDTGKVLGICVKADVTGTMAFAKIGHVNYPGRLYTGKLHIIDIGIPKSICNKENIKGEFFELDDCKSLFHLRPVDGHKGTFGHVLIVGGSRGKTGAVCLSAIGALRAGAGLVTVASPRSSQFIIAQKLTEAMTEGLSESSDGQPIKEAFDELMKLVERKKAACIGPGLGLSDEAFTFSQKVAVYCPVPLVIDADALTALTGCVEILKDAKSERILTPHPGEMARLLRCTAKDVQENRLEVAITLSRDTGAVVVLKGYSTIIASPTGRFSINSSGNSGMGTGGMGDTLTGIIGALLAQGYNAFDAARIGVFAHGLSADYALQIKGPFGYTATEAANLLPKVWQRINVG